MALMSRKSNVLRKTCVSRKIRLFEKESTLSLDVPLQRENVRDISSNQGTRKKFRVQETHYAALSET